MGFLAEKTLILWFPLKFKGFVQLSEPLLSPPNALAFVPPSITTATTASGRGQPVPRWSSGALSGYAGAGASPITCDVMGAIDLLNFCTRGHQSRSSATRLSESTLDDDPQPKKERRYHLVVLAKNATAIAIFVKLTSLQPTCAHARPGHLFAGACNRTSSLLAPVQRGTIVATRHAEA